jgi:acetoin utilization protein AcuB
MLPAMIRRTKDAMSVDPVAVEVDTPLGEAWRLMEENRVRHLPVVREGYLVGVLSDRDVAAKRGRLLPHAGKEGSVAPVVVADAMQAAPLSLSPDDTLERAAKLLAHWRIGSLPVVRGGALVGILTETDVLRVFADACRYGRLDGEADPPVSERMVHHPVVLEPGATIAEARELFDAGDCRHAPVVDGGRLVGVLSDRDLQRALGRGDPDGTPVRALLAREPVTVGPDELMSRAARRLIDHGIGALPVESDGALLGILTVTDLLAHVGRVLESPAADERS